MVWKSTFRLLTALGLVLAVMFLTAAVIVFFPLLFAAGLYCVLADLWFYLRLRFTKRIVTWDQASEHLRCHGGTLFVELGPPPGLEDRIWLLHDPIGKLDPQVPWDGFYTLQRQVWTENGALALSDDVSRWYETRLPLLARSVALVALPGGVTSRQCLSRAHFPAHSVAVVPTPELMRAVRRGFRRKRVT